MPDVNQQSLLTRRVRVMQILIAMMAIGVLAFLVVAFFLHTRINAINNAHNLVIITYVALAYGVAALIGGPSWRVCWSTPDDDGWPGAACRADLRPAKHPALRMSRPAPPRYNFPACS